MKSFITISLLALSLQSFAGVVRMVGNGECSSVADVSISAEAQKAELTNCAERKAHQDLSNKCESRGQGWLLESAIAKRGYKTDVSEEGRLMRVTAMAVGRCEF